MVRLIKQLASFLYEALTDFVTAIIMVLGILFLFIIMALGVMSYYGYGQFMWDVSAWFVNTTVSIYK